ncbi:MAG: hypothetical protein NTU57_03095 [Candidatus Aenigmarchaeota archaeon]|nr:hypothetical protein [Candidatus Aenigmarchaeota archaeon]
MNDSTGAQRGAWLTTDREYKTKGLSGVRNDTWYPAVDDNAAYENGLDIQKLCDYAVTASKATKKAIKEVYDWTSSWSLHAAGFGSAYMLTSGKDGIEWLHDLFGVLGVISLGKMIDRMDKKYKEHKKEKALEKELYENEKAFEKVKEKYYGLMKDVMTSGMDIDEKINFRYENGMDKIQNKMSRKNEYKASEVNAELDKIMETCLKRYIETRNGNHGNHNGNGHGKYGNVCDEKNVA